jgi:hypothetical protein
MLHSSLIALMVIASAPAPTPVSKPVLRVNPQPQVLHQVGSFVLNDWQVVFVGTDERVNHCVLVRETKSAKPTSAEPHFALLADQKWVILQVRSADYRFTEKKALKVTLATPDGSETAPLASTGGPDTANINFGTTRQDIAALAGSAYLDVRTGEATVRLSLDGLDRIMPAFDRCMANIGSPAKGFSDDEINALIFQPG